MLRITMGRQTRAVALACALAALTGCDKLLEVDLPAAVTEEALEGPATAQLKVSSIMGLVECSYSSMAMDASGMEDNFQMVTGVAGQYSQYDDTAGGGACDPNVYSQNWHSDLLLARGLGYKTYGEVLSYGLPSSDRLAAITAFYTAVTLGIFGDYFCEFAIDAGPLLTYSQTLDIAEAWADSALARAPATFALTASAGTVTTDFRQAALGLRARIRWANGDLAGAAADASGVSNGLMAWVLRETPEDRRNMISSMQGNGGGVQAAGFLQGPVKLKTDADDYGITALGNIPGTSTPWPSPVPFTGYIDLAIQTADGRAVDDAGHALTLADPGTEADTRVEHAIGPTAGGPDYVIAKYTSLEDDIPLVNWREMRLIEAEAAGATAAGVDFVNEIRTADGLPIVQGGYRTAVEGDATLYENLIFEERRRALWLEARWWATKLQHTDRLWFPRAVGDWINQDATYGLGGGVRLLMFNNEYELNENFGLEHRATGCPPDQAPVGF
ncbi:MAG TPA: hypothetical protein VMM35_10165 [Longimicrobiales bacterium]|nr:hypothetical protein [Longimicrobiales bacterium]